MRVMYRRLLPLGIMMLLTAVAWTEIALAWSHLPDPMYTHFSTSGAPNGTGARASYAALIVILLAVLDGMFIAIAWTLPRIPDSLINMPRKDYWLAPERRAKTMAYLIDNLSWLGAATIGLMVWLNHDTIAANLSATGRLRTGGWLPMGAYTLYVVVWLVVFLRHFFRPPQEDEPAPAAALDSDEPR